METSLIHGGENWQAMGKEFWQITMVEIPSYRRIVRKKTRRDRVKKKKTNWGKSL